MFFDKYFCRTLFLFWKNISSARKLVQPSLYAVVYGYNISATRFPRYFTRYVRLLEVISQFLHKLPKESKKTWLQLPLLTTGSFLRKLNFFFNSYFLLFKFSLFFFYYQTPFVFNKLPFYKLIFSFNKNNKLYLNLQYKSKKKNKNVMFTSPGLFIKFFEKNKSLRKHKLTKALSLKFFRRLLVISRIWKLILIVKHVPIALNEILKLFHQPVYMHFNRKKNYLKLDDYFEKKNIPKLKIRPPLFSHYLFINPKSYVKNKIKKKGRIKRKISRRLILSNHVVD